MTTTCQRAGGPRRCPNCAFLFAGLAILAIGCDIQLFDSPTATTQRSVTVEYRAGAPIEIASRNGYIHVSHDAANSEVTVEADIRCGGLNMEQAEERAENCQLVAAYTDEGSLRIEPTFLDDLHHRDGARLQVRVPSDVDLVLRTSNGEIKVSPVQGSMIKTLDAETSNGGLHVTGLHGNAKLATINGPIQARNIGGSLVARTSNGPITAANVAGKLQMDTSNGPINIELDENQSGPIQARTSNAPISAKVASGFDGRIDFRTSNSTVVVRDPQERVGEKDLSRSNGFVVVGDGASTSRLESSNGKIVVHVD